MEMMTNHNNSLENIILTTSNCFPTMVYIINHVNDITNVHGHLSNTHLWRYYDGHEVVKKSI